jgi:hypothetical protein
MTITAQFYFGAVIGSRFFGKRAAATQTGRRSRPLCPPACGQRPPGDFTQTKYSVPSISRIRRARSTVIQG